MRAPAVGVYKIKKSKASSFEFAHNFGLPEIRWMEGFALKRVALYCLLEDSAYFQSQDTCLIKKIAKFLKSN